MKLLQKLKNWTLTSSIIRAVYWLYVYINDWRIVEASLHGEAFRVILKKYLHMTARTDWLGRVYGIVNPSINENGEYDLNGMIFELDGAHTNNNEWVENWLYKQMLLVNNVYGLEQSGFFDIIDASVRHVGPQNADNYLVIFDIASRKEMARCWRRVFWQGLTYAIIGCLVLWMV